MTTVAENLKGIQSVIREACRRSNRSPEGIQIVAVTKYVSVERMEEAYRCGLTHFGENRLQDAKPKWEIFKNAVTWHFIGHLQTNKVKDVLARFDYIHSLDRAKLADEIAKYAYRQGIRPKCFIQVNVSGEASKSGISPDHLMDLARTVRDTGQIEVVGLMTMAPQVKDAEEARPFFRKLKELRQELLEKDWPGIKPVYLSMGMSSDYPVAVEEGATHLRIGTALLGKGV